MSYHSNIHFSIQMHLIWQHDIYHSDLDVAIKVNLYNLETQV